MSCLSSNFMIFLKSHKHKQKAYSDFTHDSSGYVFYLLDLSSLSFCCCDIILLHSILSIE